MHLAIIRRSLAISVLVGIAATYRASAQHETFSISRPKSLERAVEKRASLRTGKLEVRETVYNLKTPTGELLRTPEGEPIERLYSIRFANGTEVLTDRGDRNGIVTRTPDGAPHPFMPQEPRHYYSADQESINRSESPLSLVLVYKRPSGRRLDVRALGFGLHEQENELEHGIWSDSVQNPEARRYSEAIENGLYVVSWMTGRTRVTFWLDPEKDWSPVRVRQEREDFWSETRSAYAKDDGIWFPTLVETYQSDYDGGRSAARAVQVIRREFNMPDHPQQLTYADIGLEPGMPCEFRDQTSGEAFPGVWDGKQALRTNDYLKKLNSGEVQEGPNYRRAFYAKRAKRAEEARAGNAAARPPLVAKLPVRPQRWLSTWEEYVRDFIAKYKLSQEQSDKAHAILRECQDQANQYIDRKIADFQDLQRRHTELLESVPPDIEARLERIEQERKALLAPIDEIFEKRLKPRLDKLPTAAQRKAAGDKEP